MATDVIDHATLANLALAGAIHSAHIIGQPGGWGLRVKFGLSERDLAAQRSKQVRIFRKFETLVAYLKGLGIARFDVDAGNWDASSLSVRTRPDTTAALKKAHAAAAYDKWIEQEVQAAINDTSPSVSHDQAKRHFDGRRDELRKRIAAERT